MLNDKFVGESLSLQGVMLLLRETITVEGEKIEFTETGFGARILNLFNVIIPWVHKVDEILSKTVF